MNSIYSGLGKNIIEKTGMSELGKPLRIFMHNEQDEIVGGLAGNIFGGWIYISLLWIDKSIRGKGYGTKLMQMAQKEAIKSGCKHIHLDTYSFEARPFYERLGFEVFAVLEDYPQGHNKFFLKKHLA
ncbi:MAG: GNAT family N-acetyltransferase [Candidatus Thorarchaeota archaeon]